MLDESKIRAIISDELTKQNLRNHKEVTVVTMVTDAIQNRLIEEVKRG